MNEEVNNNLLNFCGDKKYVTVYADPPWQFSNKTGKIAPEYKKNGRYSTMTIQDIIDLPVKDIIDENAHLYIWVPNALLPEGLEVMKSWGFRYITNLVWEKVRKDGMPDGRGVGFYYRNVTELLLFGVKTRTESGKFRTLAPARSQVNLVRSMKREHSRKPDEFVDIINRCSVGPYIELFARGERDGWDCWGNEADPDWAPEYRTYAYHTGNESELENNSESHTSK